MTEKSIEEILKSDGMYVSTTSGFSMYPMLRDRRDTIVVTPTSGRLEKYDVALYRRGDKYVLHRVIKVLPDSYVIRGDNCVAKEYIPDSDILGKLSEAYRADKKIDLNGGLYIAYTRFIIFLHPFVTLKQKIKAIIGRISRIGKGGR